jgi:hypothetical protein
MPARTSSVYQLPVHVLIYLRYDPFHFRVIKIFSLVLWQLPRYKNEDVLREKLLQAIHAGAGFDLS